MSRFCLCYVTKCYVVKKDITFAICYPGCEPDDPQQPDHGGEQLQQPGMGFGALLAAVNMQQH